MEKTDSRYRHFVQILREELVPAMGCTEPIAIAYGAAKAREVLGHLCPAPSGWCGSHCLLRSGVCGVHR